jgi:hypothetical protein
VAGVEDAPTALHRGIVERPHVGADQREQLLHTEAGERGERQVAPVAGTHLSHHGSSK